MNCLETVWIWPRVLFRCILIGILMGLIALGVYAVHKGQQRRVKYKKALPELMDVVVTIGAKAGAQITNIAWQHGITNPSPDAVAALVVTLVNTTNTTIVLSSLTNKETACQSP